MEKTTKTSATLSKLSVAVVLDGSEGPDGPQVSEIGKLVSAAAGIDTSRGDVLAISSIPFQKAAPAVGDSSTAEAQRWEQYIQLGKIAAMVVGPVLLALLLMMSSRRGRRREKYVISEVRDPKQSALVTPAAVAALGAAQEGIPSALSNLLVDDPQDRYVRDQVTVLARAKPEVMAELIKTWLDEEGR